MKFAFYVSGNAGRLRKILENNEDFLDQVKVVISDDSENGDLHSVLEERGIKYYLFDYSRLNGNKNIELSNHMLKIFQEFKIDYCFSFGDHILKGELLKKYENKIINFHPSILPFFPGRRAIDQAIESKTFLLGCSAHFIDEGIDTGSIIMQVIMPKEVYYEEDYDGVLDTQIEMLRRIIFLLNHDRLSIENKQVKIEGADYSSKAYFPNI